MNYAEWHKDQDLAHKRKSEQIEKAKKKSLSQAKRYLNKHFPLGEQKWNDNHKEVTNLARLLKP